MARLMSALFVCLALTCSSLVFSYPLLTEQEVTHQDYSGYEMDPFRLFQLTGSIQSPDYEAFAKRRRDKNSPLRYAAPTVPQHQIIAEEFLSDGDDYHLAAKRENYLSMCHFKICNLGRKRRLSQLVKPSSRKG